jgi:hypothetical protein
MGVPMLKRIRSVRSPEIDKSLLIRDIMICVFHGQIQGHGQGSRPADARFAAPKCGSVVEVALELALSTSECKSVLMIG